MSIDVRAETTIGRTPSEVAAFAMDPTHDPEWIGGIREARPLTELPVREGTRVERVAYFLGKRIEYVLEVVEHRPDALLRMESVAGPFPMKVTYGFAPDGQGTRASIRVQGDSRGFFKLWSPLMAMMVRRNIGKDLRRLAKILS